MAILRALELLPLLATYAGVTIPIYFLLVRNVSPEAWPPASLRDGLGVASLFAGLMGLVIYSQVSLGGYIGFGFLMAFIAVSVSPPLVMGIGKEGWFRALGFRLPKDWVTTAALLVFTAVYGTSSVTQQLAYRSLVTPSGLLVGIINPAILEELLFRGFIQTRLMSLIGLTKGVLVASLLFGLWHVPTDFFGATWRSIGMNPGTAVLTLVMQTVFGLVMGVAFTKTRSLLPNFAGHYLANYGSSLLRLFA